MVAWPRIPAELERVQSELAERALEIALWQPPVERCLVGGAFAAFSTTRSMVGTGVERVWAAAVSWESGVRRSSAVVAEAVDADYAPGYLALREGSLLERAVRSLDVRPDVLIVNASGRDHPRRAGLALHLGAVLGVASVGVTDRPLAADGAQPGPEPGASAPLFLEGELVGYWLRTRCGVRPVCAHAAWRTDPGTAREVVMAAVRDARTPEPLRLARFLARSSRARDEGRTPPGWTQDRLPDPRLAGRGRGFA
ncbi:MAG: endonuclease V [Actinomycetota bacterium]